MKPSRIQYFFAKNWPAKIWLGAFGGVFTVGAARVVVPAIRSEHLGWGTISYLVVIPSALVVGVLLGFLTAFPVLYPLYSWRAKLNGAPFQRGDVVEILVGEHRGKRAQIYELWDERGQVRVDLGKAAKNQRHRRFPPRRSHENRRLVDLVCSGSPVSIRVGASSPATSAFCARRRFRGVYFSTRRADSL
jgi:hypothetical protein